jgi:hypothetical protein
MGINMLPHTVHYSLKKTRVKKAKRQYGFRISEITIVCIFINDYVGIEFIMV